MAAYFSYQDKSFSAANHPMQVGIFYTGVAFAYCLIGYLFSVCVIAL